MRLYRIIIESMGHVWHIPASHIATNYANHYAKVDPETTFEEEYQGMLECPDDCVEWFLDNMDWSDVKDVAKLVKTPEPISKPDWFTAAVDWEEIDPNVKYEGIK